MEQLYYTSCRPSASVSGNSGFQIRAASSGITPDRQRLLAQYMNYSLLQDASIDDPGTLRAPARLALLRLPDETILVHSVDCGRDPTTGRLGNFFSHLVAGIPSNIDVLDALSLWGSPFWQRQDDDTFGTTLPPLEHLPTGSWTPSNSREETSSSLLLPPHREWIAFLLSAYLGQRRKLFIVTDPSTFVLLLRTMSFAIPPSIRRSLSFSTYEPQPQSSPASIIGTVFGEAHGTDLPETCYIGLNACLNTITGRKSADLEILPFAHSAVQALVDGALTHLAEVGDICDKLGLDDGRLMDLVEPALLRQGSAHQIGVENAQRVLSHRNLAVAWLAQPKVPEYVAHLCVTNRPFSAQCLDEIATISAEDPSIQETIAEAVESLGFNSVSSNAEHAFAAWEKVLPKIDPRQGAQVWHRLLDRFSHSIALSQFQSQDIPLSTRLRLISVWSEDRTLWHSTQLEKVARSWLQLNGEDIPNALSSRIPTEYKIHAACEALLSRTPVPLAAIRALVANKDTLRQVLQRLSSLPEGSKPLRDLLDRGAPDTIEMTLQDVSRDPTGVPPRLVEELLTKLTQDADSRILERLALLLVAKRHILGRFESSHALAMAVDKVIASWGSSVLRDSTCCSALHNLLEASPLPCSPKTTRRLQAFHTVDRFRRSNTLPERDVAKVVEAATLLGLPLDRQVGQQIKSTVLATIQTQSQLEIALLALGQMGLGDPPRLCQDLAQSLKHRDSQSRLDGAEALLKVCLGEIKEPEVMAEFSRAPRAIENTVVEVVRKLPDEQYRELVRRKGRWPKEARDAWGNLEHRFRQPSLFSRLFHGSKTTPKRTKRR